MTGALQTEREAALAARVKELQAEAAARNLKMARGGVFESIWQTATAIVPGWVAAATLGIWLAHQGFVYYVNAQIGDAKTQYDTAKADLDTARANAISNPVDGGEALLVEQKKAELLQRRAEAIRAQVEAEALTTQEHDTTLRIATVNAEIATTREKAAKARADADAMLDREGGKTLAEREQRAKAVIAEMEAAQARISVALASETGEPRALVRVICEHNQFPELIGCPAKYQH